MVPVVAPLITGTVESEVQFLQQPLFVRLAYRLEFAPSPTFVADGAVSCLLCSFCCAVPLSGLLFTVVLTLWKVSLHASLPVRL